MTQTTNPRTQAKEILTANWQDLITSGDMTAEEMAESLQDQISGMLDLSADELTSGLADLMGWDIDDMTEDQLNEWQGIVDETAREWLGR